MVEPENRNDDGGVVIDEDEVRDCAQQVRWIERKVGPG